MRRIYQIKSNIGFGILLAIFIASYANSTMFNHEHVIDGATIVHSHFYGAHHTDSDDGGHASEELILLTQLALSNNLIASQATTISEVVAQELYAIAIPIKVDKEHGKLSSIYSTRGPPAFFL
ncbi:MAG: hypothetical protein R3Y15_06740 [Rikenellaceae bacterium]